MSSDVTQKKKMGRPVTGKAKGNTPIIAVRIQPETIRKIEAWAKGKSLSRSEAIRWLILSRLEQNP